MWREFHHIFAKPIREKFQNGIQFPKEGFFEENPDIKPKTVNFQKIKKGLRKVGNNVRNLLPMQEELIFPEPKQ